MYLVPHLSDKKIKNNVHKISLQILKCEFISKYWDNYFHIPELPISLWLNHRAKIPQALRLEIQQDGFSDEIK